MKVMKMFWILSLFLGLSSCISEDIVNDEIDESIRINTNFSNFAVGQSLVLDALFFDSQGIKQTVDFSLKSNNTAVITVDNTTKKINAISKGDAEIVISTFYEGKSIETIIAVTVIENSVTPTPVANVKIGSITKTSSYASAGDFEITEIPGGIRIKFASNYRADQSLPGFAMYLTNNPNVINGALKIDSQGDADGVTYNGAFTLDVMGVGINDYGYLTHWCEPFKIKVGEAIIKNK
ncbi:hypothetical protein HNQ02_000506 [Flavobacterium sp. 7E]|uniref:hypothetical protein n=1 Tax=Flavobacterium sp. 7E TaxID=2735898 RepID=UPI00156E4381|nr:hypothetical protein [Flavobacterium sp. 7E]NRS87599.1 hypothetical protein [Flavobacterium sp. 7E]